jgi:hypothetical protein
MVDPPHLFDILDDIAVFCCLEIDILLTERCIIIPYIRVDLSKQVPEIECGIDVGVYLECNKLFVESGGIPR